jgi:hypothetical protein
LLISRKVSRRVLHPFPSENQDRDLSLTVRPPA